jgi:hypothetical protein
MWVVSYILYYPPLGAHLYNTFTRLYYREKKISFMLTADEIKYHEFKTVNLE